MGLHQHYERTADGIARTLRVGGTAHLTTVEDRGDGGLAAEAAFWQSCLRGARVRADAGTRPLRVVDAFCGSGGLGLGLSLAAEATGRRVDFSAIVDTDETALSIHCHKLGARRRIAASAASLVDFHVVDIGPAAHFGYRPEVVSGPLASVGPVDVFIAGPPCQGHSNLNNHTRRQDPRNDLYVTAAALGVALDAEVVLIENVPTVQNAHRDVVSTAAGLLASSGYGVSMGVLRADELGAAQRRARHVLLASRRRDFSDDWLVSAVGGLRAPAMPLSWVIGDLVGRTGGGLLDTSPALTPVNTARLDYLFDHDLHDLPDEQRPDCHRNGTTYTSVYGRMHWDRPAQTVTTGFGTPGQGRYIHPLERRVITPREAAPIQGFPDWFEFAPPAVPPKRKNLAKWIGDAVHPALGYAAGVAALASVSEAPSLALMSAA